MASSINKIILRFLALPVAARLGLSLLGSVIGGLGVGIISEYAAYSYALNIGFRPPFEGIPYLRATVGAFAVLLLLGLFTAFTLVYYAIGVPLAFVKRSFESVAEHIRTWAVSDEEYVKQDFATIKEYLDSRLWKTVEKFYGMDFSPVRESFARGDNSLASLVLMGDALKQSKYLNPAIPIWLASLAGVLAVVGLCVGLFHTETYRKVLCTMDYGGHIPVTLQVRNDGAPRADLDHGELVLRSELTITIWNGSIYREYPLESVRAIDYPASFACFQ